MNYPEHEKLKLIKERSQCLGEFLMEWLPSKGWAIYDEDTPDKRPWPVLEPGGKILAEFFGIDQKRLDQEKRAMLAECRAMNEERFGDGGPQDYGDST